MVRIEFQWFHVRVSYEDIGQRDCICVAVKNISNQYLIVNEVSEKEVDHIHANVLTKLSESKLRTLLIPKVLKEKKMSKYIKKLEELSDVEKLDQYICKGTGPEYVEESNPQVVAKSAIKYTSQYIQECHKKYWEINGNLKKKEKQFNIITEVAYQLKSKRKEPIKANSSIDRRIVMGMLLDSLRNKGKGFDVIIIKRLINGVLNILDPIGMAAYIESQLFDECSRTMDI